MNGQEVWRKIAVLNQKYEADDYNGESAEGDNFVVFGGKRPIVVSAPHAVKQLRNGRVKLQDGMTGGIVEYLVERFELYGVVRRWNAGDDPNFAEDERSMAYRDRVAETVGNIRAKWVFDVHACRDEYGFDIDVGINGGENLACDGGVVEKLVEFWQEEGLDVRVDEKFRAARLNTVSNYVHRKTGVNCLQIELAEEVRMGSEKMGKFLRGFEKVLEVVDRGD